MCVSVYYGVCVYLSTVGFVRICVLSCFVYLCAVGFVRICVLSCFFAYLFTVVFVCICVPSSICVSARYALINVSPVVYRLSYRSLSFPSYILDNL